MLGVKARAGDVGLLARRFWVRCTMSPGNTEGKSTEMQLSDAPVTPFLKWAGGKRWLVANYSELIPQKFSRYVEPFLGSGAVFFYLKPNAALLSDLNGDLIATYMAIRDDWEAVADLLDVHARKHDEDYYYQQRATIPRSRIRAAARFIYLNRTCWNGLYRVNRAGIFNVPKGTKNSVVLESDDFEALSKVLQGAELQVCDFEKTIDSASEGDLVFVDPPYTVKHNLNGFIKYNDKIFSWADQIRLRDVVKKACDRGAIALVTNANHKSVRELYSGFKMKTLVRASVIAGSPAGRGSTEEILITN